MAGIVGPTVAAYIYEHTSSYELTFYLFAILLIVAFGLSFLIRRSLMPKGVTLTFLKKEGQV
jgi:MFS family permease